MCDHVCIFFLHSFSVLVGDPLGSKTLRQSALHLLSAGFQQLLAGCDAAGFIMAIRHALCAMNFGSFSPKFVRLVTRPLSWQRPRIVPALCHAELCQLFF